MNEDVNPDMINKLEEEIFSFDIDFFDALTGDVVDFLAKNNELKYAIDLIEWFEHTANKAGAGDKKTFEDFYQKAYVLCNDYLAIYKDDPNLIKKRVDCAKALGFLYVKNAYFDEALKFLSIYSENVFSKEYTKENVKDICELTKNQFFAYYGLQDNPSAYNFLDSLLEWKLYEYSLDLNDENTANEIHDLIRTAYKEYSSEALYERGKLIINKCLDRIDISAKGKNPLALLIQLDINIFYAFFLSNNKSYTEELYHIGIKCFKLTQQLTQGVGKYQKIFFETIKTLFGSLAFTVYKEYELDYQLLKELQKAMNDSLAFVDYSANPRKEIKDIFIDIPTEYAAMIEMSDQYIDERNNLAAGISKTDDYIQLRNYFNRIAQFVERKI
ncbi:hypothetical protein LJC25_04770 [Bacteroidales bacterium OttesenSCG-928-K03]|nr:hypothetical protein [Bacteroidales bacterium OttesenSCG-928-L14]MDL2240330.1 hypothetical protein [Bacteroidales bacterium OttesenSCG-928-K22]MDL2243023.1 hypothetical protein [Bacteroidales bacterium OttesenSCG-928-K03]